MGLILRYSIGRDQPLPTHNAPNAASGYEEAMLMEFDLDLSGAVGFTILVKNLYNRIGQFVVFCFLGSQ